MQDIHGRRRAARRTGRAATAATTLATAAALTACSVLGGDGADPGGSDATGDAGGGTVVLLTHEARETDVRAALALIAELPALREPPVVLRIVR